MADVMCRWRNATPETVCEFVEKLPHKKMKSADFRNQMGPQFFHTPYQLACQLGLYYEDGDVYIPRFDHNVDKNEAQLYLEQWVHCYYAPNPYTKSLKSLKEPVFLIFELVKYMETHNGSVELRKALEDIFIDKMGNLDIITNAINNYSRVINVEKGFAKLNDNYREIMNSVHNRSDKKAFFENFDFNLMNGVSYKTNVKEYLLKNRMFFSALRTKPFLLLAGISGTGKSRIVRELAFKSCPECLRDTDGTTPGNYLMVEVKPNWHDSTELLGYWSNLTGKYLFTNFVKFLVKAKMHPKVPFFVCLDEMNLAPVEQYFAEFLSVLETRKRTADGIQTGVLVGNEWFKTLAPFNENGNPNVPKLTDKDIYLKFFNQTEDEIKENVDEKTTLFDVGLSLPENVFIVGTVNMDDTTHQFSRKVIDRAMTIEMNGGELTDIFKGKEDLTYTDTPLTMDDLGAKYITATDAVEQCPTLTTHEDYRQYVMGESSDGGLPKRLAEINRVLSGTPFTVSYRVMNELTIHLAVLLDEAERKGALDKPKFDSLVDTALDHILLMKILPRIEGDDEMFRLSNEEQSEFGVSHVNGHEATKLDWLRKVAPQRAKEPLKEDTTTQAHAEGVDNTETAPNTEKQEAKNVSLAIDKIDEMIERLTRQNFTRFWP